MRMARGPNGEVERSAWLMHPVFTHRRLHESVAVVVHGDELREHLRLLRADVDGHALECLDLNHAFPIDVPILEELPHHLQLLRIQARPIRTHKHRLPRLVAVGNL